MFKDNEDPIMHVLIDDKATEIYFENLKKIIEYSDFSTIIIDFDSACLRWHIEKIKDIISNNCTEKTFFVRGLDKTSILNNDHIVSCNVLNAKHLFNNNVSLNKCDVIFIQFDIADDFSNYNWKVLEKFVNTGINYQVFIELINTKLVLNIENSTKIMNSLTKLDATFYLSPLFKDILTISEHPCNIYLCSGETCHSNKSVYPRYLYISSTGMHPYLCIDSQLTFFNDIMGIRIDNIEMEMENYAASEAYLNFKKCNKKLYHEFVLPRVASIFSWNIMLDYAVSELI